MGVLILFLHSKNIICQGCQKSDLHCHSERGEESYSSGNKKN